MTASASHALRAFFGDAWEALVNLAQGRDHDTPAELPAVDMGEVGHLSVAQGRPHVLVIDDDADLRGMLADALRIHGYAVSEAGDGEQALNLLNSFSQINAPLPQLILLDCIMPPGDVTIQGEDGEEVRVPAGLYFYGRILSKNERWRTIPVVLMSTPDVLAMYPQFRRLPKPIAIGTLLDCCRRHAST